RIQPSSGGFLEAAPLTSFVAMSLAGAGRGDSPVARRAEEFLVAGQREDGSWAIDSNLAMWVTTLAVNALGTEPAAWAAGGPGARARTLDWVLAGQHGARHAYTGAAPGGWAWTDLPGGVPDADDTAGALLALRQLDPTAVETRAAGALGVRWLLSLQNSDGGMPTFCRGWGHLPFDRSGADLTAHALRAWNAWLPALPALRGPLRRAIERALRYLGAAQRPDGSWVPLWFGNENAPGDENPTYGTARVVTALAALDPCGEVRQMCVRGAKWLAAAQHQDGGFGGAPGAAPTIEETAVAASALADAARTAPELTAAALRAGVWLAARTEDGAPPSPIGFYFAKLWYHEDAYPVIFAIEAFSKMLHAHG
ncbi:MAG TPA: squalene--hopene cyclase, partial [Planctomycetes bacterium]|nr:squalene--hopene cyclase [Planctomycetota bacterium]